MPSVPAHESFSGVVIRTAQATDAGSICGIYNRYIANIVATFDEAPVPAADTAHRIESILAAGAWCVAERAGSVAGFAYAQQWTPRSAYRHAVEATVYIARGLVGRDRGSPAH